MTNLAQIKRTLQKQNRKRKNWRKTEKMEERKETVEKE